MKKYLLIGIVVLVAATTVLAVYFVNRKGSQEKPGERFIVRRDNVTYFTEQTGIVKARVGAIVKVGTRATGTLTELKYQVGDAVKKGELIARIDDRELLANIRNTRATIES